MRCSPLVLIVDQVEVGLPGRVQVLGDVLDVKDLGQQSVLLAAAAAWHRSSCVLLSHPRS